MQLEVAYVAAMKDNKNLFFILTIFLFLFVGCKKMNSSNNVLNAPLRFPINLKELDGRKIVTALDYQMLINLNLTLLTYEKNTDLVTLLAEDYDIQDKTIIFHLKKGVRTRSGHEIKAIDAEVSLKRVIAAKASHSRLAELLCPDIANNQCSNITSNEYELRLFAKKKSYIPFILNLLTSADNVILPLTSLDSNLPTSKIINFKETSGPYFIDHDKIEDKPLNHVELTINPDHFLYNENLAKKISYTLIKEEELITGNKLNPKFNYIHNVMTLTNESIDKINIPESNLIFFNTNPLRNSMVFTTKRGKENFSIHDLLHHSLFIKTKLLKSRDTYPNIRQLQIEYFPSGSDGTLRPEQLQTLLDKYLETPKNKPEKMSFTLGLYPGNFKKFGHLFKGDKNITLVELTNSSLKSSVDFYISTVDSTIEESLDILEYNKNFGIFKVTDEEIKSYVDAESKQERIKILQDVHFNSLMSGFCLNLGSSPYVTILSKDWHADPSSVQVGFPVWKIVKKN